MNRHIASRDWLLLLGLVVAVFLVYQPAWHGSLLWDDDSHVTAPEFRSLHGLGRIWFDTEAWRRADRPWYEALGATQQYYPLLHSFFWLQWQLWGNATLGYHLVNIALHATAAVLVAMILRRLKVPGALLAAAIFALHPVAVESVAWITEQKNTLSAVFYLAAALVYLRFDEKQRSRHTPCAVAERSRHTPCAVAGGAGRVNGVLAGVADGTRRVPATLSYILALGLFVLGLLSKTVTATLPAALLVVFWWQRGWLPWRKGLLPWRRDVLPLVPFFVLGAAGGMLTALVERKLIGAEGAEYPFTLIERLLMAGRVIWFYLGKLCWPADLIFFYPRWNISQAVWWQYLFPLAALLLLAVLWLLALRRQWRAPLAGLLFFVGTLFPVLGFLDVYPFRHSLVADHFQYLASLGIITLAAAGLALLMGRWGVWHRPAGRGLCLVLLAVLATLTRWQTRMYADGETLYATTIQRNPDCWVAYANLGFMGINQGRVDDGIAYCRRALEINPDNPDAHNSLGLAAASQGRLDEALACFRQAVRSRPGFILAHLNLSGMLTAKRQVDEAIAECRIVLAIKPGCTEAYTSLGAALASNGQFDEAAGYFRQALALRPNYAEAHNDLGRVLAATGRFDEAIVHYQQALAIRPDYTEASHYLRIATEEQNRVLDTIAQWREAVRLQPEDVAAFNRLAWALATCPLASVRNGPEAVRLAQRAAALSDPKKPAILDTLAAAYAEAGRFDEAVSTAQQAIELADSSGDASLASRIRKRMELYRSGHAFRDGPRP